MNCFNCGSHLSEIDLDYCPHCGSNVLIQKKIDYLSKLYYNKGLEKASVRDLSGAISCLQQSLAYNKNNIQARNLLGLVFFETGEVVAALSEWVISENLQPNHNLAGEYIDKLQENPAKLEAINETIRKYNHALQLCRDGHEDMAAVELKKVLSQNSKLIKGYHLLALIQIRDHEWTKVRRTLRKAIRIDRTNTTTLRFLHEVDEQTGVATRIDGQKRVFFGRGSEKEENVVGADYVLNPPALRMKRRISFFTSLMTGAICGGLGFYLLIMPAIRQGIYREANEQIIRYSETVSGQNVEVNHVQGIAGRSDSTAESMMSQVEGVQKKADSYENLIKAYNYVRVYEYDEAALAIQNVYVSTLTDDMMSMYNTVVSETGVRGIEEDEETAYEKDFSDDESYEEGYEESYDESYDYDAEYEESYDDYSEEW